jgi:hypothetical protein
MRYVVGLISSALLLLAPFVQAQTGAVPAGGDPALACKQKPDGRAYWMEYGFCDLPVKGPVQAKGLVLWSHGVSGHLEQFHNPPPPVVRAMALEGWEVLRINRNNLYERNWTSAGVRHRDDAIERLRAAKAQGYRKVILAGQSYGAMISFDANAKTTEIDGVLALSPGTGSDAANASGAGNYRNINRYLLDTGRAQKGGRVVLLFADGDHLHPDRWLGSGFGDQMRAALGSAGVPFVLFDENGPIRGHGAGTTPQFSAWFGDCVRHFLDPTRPVKPGETVCKAPDPVPRFLLPANLKRPTPGHLGPARWLGVWEGTYGDNQRDLMIVVEAVTDDMATVVYAPGAGPNRDLPMGYDRYVRARVQGNAIHVDRGSGRTIVLTLSADGRSAAFRHLAKDGTALDGTLARAR